MAFGAPPFTAPASARCCVPGSRPWHWAPGTLLLLNSLCGCQETVPLGALTDHRLTSDASSSEASSSPTGSDRPGETGGVLPPPALVPPPDVEAPPAMGSADAGSDPPLPLPQCGQEGEPQPFNQPGAEIGPTEVRTDWLWPAPTRALQWELVIERDVAPRSAVQAPTGGYYWSHHFTFEEGVAGIFGIQSEGGYQSDPPDSRVQFTSMAVFWLSGPPLAGELGDIAYPDARVAPMTASGAQWLTIHARLEWQECHVYRFRVAPHSEDEEGNVWYGAWITDVTDDVETFLGRMLLPTDTGALVPFSTSRTAPIDFGALRCDEPDPVSAMFGAPFSEQDGWQARHGTTRFSSRRRCPTSRFTYFERAVRHELSVSD